MLRPVYTYSLRFRHCHSQGGACVAGACVGGGVHGKGICVAGGRGVMRGRRERAWQGRRPLQRTVRILLECILVYSWVSSDDGPFDRQIRSGTHFGRQCKFEGDRDGDGKRILRPIHTERKRRRKRCLNFFFHLLRSFFDRLRFSSV